MLTCNVAYAQFSVIFITDEHRKITATLCHTHTHTHTRIQCQSSFAAIYYYNNKCSGLFPWVRALPQHLPAEKMLAFFACQRKVCVFFQVVNMENVEQIALIAVVAVAV